MRRRNFTTYFGETCFAQALQTRVDLVLEKSTQRDKRQAKVVRFSLSPKPPASLFSTNAAVSVHRVTRLRYPADSSSTSLALHTSSSLSLALASRFCSSSSASSLHPQFQQPSLRWTLHTHARKLHGRVIRLERRASSAGGVCAAHSASHTASHSAGAAARRAAPPLMNNS